VITYRFIGWSLLALACGCGSAESPSEGPSRSLQPAVRRLSTAELETSAQTLLGSGTTLAAALPPDARQSDYSRNIAQSVDSLLLGQLFDATRSAAEGLDLSQAQFPSCARTALESDRECAQTTVSLLARAAFRRSPSALELQQLLTLFTLGADGADFKSGIALVVRALLGSPKFLYATTLGAGASGPTRLSNDELGSELSLLISGQPPDEALQLAAARGELASGHERERQALRLLQLPGSRGLYRRFVQEWLGLIGLDGLAKSSQVVTGFPVLREAMIGETNQFIDDVFGNRAGSVAALLAGGYSIVPEALAGFYGIAPTTPGARVSLAGLGRVGILQQASFLATFAHESESAPVLRGKAVLTRVLCRDFPKPTELGIDVVFPAADPNATTRERFARHATDALCKGCHATLDSVGFAFENFDAAGALRESESGRAVDTSGSLQLDGRMLALEDSAALSRALANSAEVRDCAARQVVRFAAGRTDVEVEQAFVDSLAAASAERRGTFLGLFLTFVESDWFAWRSPR
jgi:uncharacterized protein DUF1588/uncharacterized protein DUF1592/uncharacterized protein DUF1595/uncharacterized protein DUF1585/uncharacterized protein DUF1587